MAYEIRDICTPRAGKDNKTFWHKIGTAFIGDDGKIGLTFDSLPIPDAEGRVAAQIFKRQEKDAARNAHPAKGYAEAKGSAPAGDLDDSVPF